MKLRTKFALLFSAIISLVFAVSILVVGNRLTDYVMTEKEAECSRATRQMISSASIILSDVEDALRDQYSDMELIETLTDESIAQETRSRNLVSKLRYICYNSSYFDAVALMDNDGQLYFGAKSLHESEVGFSNIVNMRLDELRGNYTVWFDDDGGNVFVKKDLYSVIPLYRAGILIARLNTSMVSSMLSLSQDEDTDGVTAVLYGSSLILQDKELGRENAAELYQQYLADSDSYNGFVMMNGEKYWLSASGYQKTWYALSLLSADEMLRIPRFLQNVNLITGLICVLVSVVLVYILCRSLTKGIQRLNQGMNIVGEGRFDIRVPIGSRDEIGQLTSKFNAFVERLGNTTRAMVTQATAKRQMEFEMLELKYRSLQAQISPHFICNILTSIKGLAALRHIDSVGELSVLASRYLRQNLNNADAQFVTLDAEIDNIRKYLQLCSRVYGGEAVLSVQMPPELADFPVPYLLLQPLVENAVQHGGFERLSDALITLTVKKEDRFVFLELTDNGAGIPEEVLDGIRGATASMHSPDETLPGFGIRSVLIRLRLLYEEKQNFSITCDGTGTRVVIRLPLSQSTAFPLIAAANG